VSAQGEAWGCTRLQLTAEAPRGYLALQSIARTWWDRISCHHVGAEGDSNEELSQFFEGWVRPGHRHSARSVRQFQQQQQRRGRRRRVEPDHDRRIAVALG